ncbi:phospholipid/cholesterol/gamma-HCH transport system substrate-binding protein [Haloechinothrix alba]|uniref:Phospholipid/cholesterol/gamma-HCH transport system substrate-binding protein n=1 Tax=Haloechinothrix alba TaxID=664784 RepID=A0A238YJN5_9PSEU|nr:MlaD family protein [Haloechinothrix alba]SNR70619.1 phospholipid/cholesterol/gamma-HCH transport system substrate-binding protein [Haloechinothrix alba]
MLGRSIRIKLVAFVVVASVSVVYALVRFTDFGEYFGQEGYTVTAELADSGGIFSHAEVTYRGVNVGRVGELRLDGDGLEVDLHIEHDAPDIPRDLDAIVANRSAIGEQYVDLRPRANSGPYLEEGTTIPQERTSIPLGVEDVITDLDKLARSLPHEDARTLVDESYVAFRGTGDDLERLMDTTREFVAASSENLPHTVRLLRSGNTVLETQNEQAGNFKSFSRDLNLLSEQLVESDEDIRNLIDATTPAAQQFSEVVQEIGPGLSSLVANLLAVSNVQAPRLDGLEQVLVSYPILAVGADAVLTDDGKARLGFVLNLFDPPPCTRGYEGTERRAGTDDSPVEPNREAYCAEPPGSPIAVRGAQNAPFAGVPSLPSEDEVEANSDRSQESLEEERRRQAASANTPGLAGGSGSTNNSLAELLGLPG